MKAYNRSKLFYDEFGTKLIRDYIFDNKRMRKAIEFVNSHLNAEYKTIADIGCGIGWSTHEISSAFPFAIVFGVDLSPNSIQLAKSLFPVDNIKFLVANIIDKQLPYTSIDAIVLIDVYEHIKIEDRKDLIKSFQQVLAEFGAIFLTCPTPKHQAHLAQFHPYNLQPVDEDVTKEDLEDIALGINGKLVYYKEVSIFSNGDYFHAIIKKGVFQPISINRIRANEKISNRFKRLKKSGNYDFLEDELKKIIANKNRPLSILKMKTIEFGKDFFRISKHY